MRLIPRIEISAHLHILAMIALVAGSKSPKRAFLSGIGVSLLGRSRASPNISSVAVAMPSDSVPSPPSDRCERENVRRGKNSQALPLAL